MRSFLCRIAMMMEVSIFRKNEEKFVSKINQALDVQSNKKPFDKIKSNRYPLIVVLKQPRQIYCHGDS